MTAQTVAISLGGCDFGSSGVGVFARAVVPRLVADLEGRGIGARIIGSREEIDGIGIVGGKPLVLPGALNPPGRNALFSLGCLPLVARAAGAGALYLPAANRRSILIHALPTVGTVHDLAQFHVENKYGRARDVYIRHVLTPTLRRLDQVLAVSQATADDAIRTAGVPEQRVRVVPNGVTLADASDRPSPRTSRYLLYPCRLEHPGKNHVRLLEAFAQSSLSDTHELVLSGKDWGAQERIEQTIDALGLQERVSLVGFISREELTHLTTHADVVVVAGLFEGFGLPAAEALALGRTVACSNTGSLPEVVGELAALFDPYDVESIARALERAANDTELRKRCADEGPTWVRKFSWDGCAKSVADALVEVAGW